MTTLKKLRQSIQGFFGDVKRRDHSATEPTSQPKFTKEPAWPRQPPQRWKVSSDIIGIDLGTTNSVAAVMKDGRPTIIPSVEGSRLRPSIVAVNPETGERMVGQAAKRQAITNPKNTITSVKRYMGRKFADPEVQRIVAHFPYNLSPAKNGDVRVWMGGKEYSPAEISAMILEKLKVDAEAYLGQPVTQAVITVPAYFDDSQRQATKVAGRMAGLEVLRIINESTAASLTYGLNRAAGEITIAVYHLGGGTFDISILDVGSGVFEVRSTAGDTFLGGDDWDHCLTDWVIEQFEETQHINLRQDPQAVERIRDACGRAKIELSTVMEVDIDIPYITVDASGPKNLQVVLTRLKLEHLTSNLVERTIEPCKRALGDARLKPADIDAVLLVGGMTRMPAVQKRVGEFFHKQPQKGVNPDEVVALGAAIQAGVLNGAVDVLLLDVIPLTLSVVTLGGVANSLIERNTTIPTRKSQIFSTTEDNQSQVDIHVVQGEHPMAEDNKHLGVVVLDGIQPAPRGTPQIEVTFEIDANGILIVSAKDKATGRERSVEIIPSIGLGNGVI